MLFRLSSPDVTKSQPTCLTPQQPHVKCCQRLLGSCEMAGAVPLAVCLCKLSPTLCPAILPPPCNTHPRAGDAICWKSPLSRALQRNGGSIPQHVRRFDTRRQTSKPQGQRSCRRCRCRAARLKELKDCVCVCVCVSTFFFKRIPSHQLTWVWCTDACRRTTFLLERAFLHFHVSWWEGTT